FSVICSEYVCPGIITERFMFTNHFCVRMRHDDAFLIFDNDKIYAVFKNILVGQRLDLFVITQSFSEGERRHQRSGRGRQQSDPYSVVIVLAARVREIEYKP